MSKLLDKNSDNLLLLELVNEELKKDLKEILMQIASSKQTASNLEKYETKKKHVENLLKTDKAVTLVVRFYTLFKP
jgi:hypothetical protein